MLLLFENLYDRLWCDVDAETYADTYAVHRVLHCVVNLLLIQARSAKPSSVPSLVRWWDENWSQPLCWKGHI